MVTRRCPRCAGHLAGEPGRVWLTCDSCPIALDASSGRTLPTFRPRETGVFVQRLPFYLWTADGRTHWVNAFRCFSQPSRQSAGAALGACALRPELVEAPLGALVARSPEQALALAGAALVPLPPEGVADLRLVSLGCETDGELLREPRSGWCVRSSLVRPRLLAYGSPGSGTSSESGGALGSGGAA